MKKYLKEIFQFNFVSSLTWSYNHSIYILCMYVHMHVCMCECVCIMSFVHICTHVSMCVYVPMCIYFCMCYKNMYDWIFVCVYLCVSVWVCVWICVCLHVCMCTCMFMCAYMYIYVSASMYICVCETQHLHELQFTTASEFPTFHITPSSASLGVSKAYFPWHVWIPSWPVRVFETV